ncbi:MAG: hypothetical protein AAF409_13535 [Pseudomonadota bacterium]
MRLLRLRLLRLWLLRLWLLRLRELRLLRLWLLRLGELRLLWLWLLRNLWLLRLWELRLLGLLLVRRRHREVLDLAGRRRKLELPLQGALLLHAHAVEVEELPELLILIEVRVDHLHLLKLPQLLDLLVDAGSAGLLLRGLQGSLAEHLLDWVLPERQCADPDGAKLLCLGIHVALTLLLASALLVALAALLKLRPGRCHRHDCRRARGSNPCTNTHDVPSLSSN